MRAWWFFVAVPLVGVGYWHWATAPIRHDSGIYPRGMPEQLADEGFTTSRGEFRIQSRARYDLRGRLVARALYRTSSGAKLAPVDLGMTWDSVADQAVVDKLQFSLEDRFLWASWSLEPPLPPDQLFLRIGNIHAIPASEAIERQLKRLRLGQFVRLQGYLVDAESPRGFAWRTSLTRSDTGPGACEILYVQRVTIIQP